jgi:FG-GAP repeat/Bacterial lectin
MFRSTRLDRAVRRARGLLPVTAAAALIAPAAPAAAAPLSATSFVKGVPVGTSLASAAQAIVGDVNGDGKDDTAFGYVNEVWVVYGASPTADIDLSTDLGTRGFKISTGTNGPVEDLSAAGDFDRDGIDDLAVSTETTTFIVHGARSSTSTLTLAAGGRMTALTGKGGNDVEDDVDPAGDFNGDGYSDVVLQRGAVGAAIVAGGPRVSSIALGSATGRVSLLNAPLRCGFVWFTFRCVYMGLPIEPIGDFDGDGLDDIAIENTNTPGNYVLYGRTGAFTTTPDAGAGRTKLPARASSDSAWDVNDFAPAGDVNGDGLDDALGWGAVIVPGRRGRPSAIGNADPVIRLTTASTRAWAVAAGDQDGDGSDDLVVPISSGGTRAPLRVLTKLPKTAPATVNTDGGTVVPGMNGYQGVVGGGDLDGDGQPDLLVGSPYPSESAYLVTHGGGAIGSTNRPASLEAEVNVADAAGNPVASKAVLQTTCAGQATTQVITGNPTLIVPNASENDSCTVRLTVTLMNPAAYAGCRWTTTGVLNYATTIAPADSAFTLTAGRNNYRLGYGCQPPVTDPPAGFTQRGWWSSGQANEPGANTDWLELTDGPNQASSLMWPYPIDYRNRTIEFLVRMAGGTGSADGMTVAFVQSSGGNPVGGRVGGSGAKLGFGGLTGVAVALDVKQDAGDPSANFLGFTDGSNASGGLNWLRTANPGVALRIYTGQKIKIVNRAGTTTVYVNGTARLSGPLAIPASAHLAFTGSSSDLYQFQSAVNLAITAS